MQDDLFGAPPAPPPQDTKSAYRTGIHPAAWGDDLQVLAERLPPTLRLGTSSWSYPGWKGIVWEGDHSEQTLSRNGLPIYAKHPLLRTVSIDRGFYRPLTVADYLHYAGQVPPGFRFVVKAPSLVADALVRAEGGRGREPNPSFLDPQLAADTFVAPALEGLGERTGALVFQLSPLPLPLLQDMAGVLERLRAMLKAQPALDQPDAVLAVEVRDPEWLSPRNMPHFADVLKSAGATYCLGLHARMPPLQDQLPLLRLLWPGPLVCRWNLHPVHGPYGYEDAEKRYAPYDRIHDPAPDEHALLARTLAGVCGRGQNAFVTISNHAAGCAPLTVRRLAEHVAAQAPRS